MSDYSTYVDIEDIKKAIATLQEPGSVFEVRVVGTKGKKDIISGYFKDADTLLANFRKIDLRMRNVYITLGKLKEECFARAQSERFVASDITTSDTEVISYRWLFVDLDPVRTAGISSSNEELAYAKSLTVKVKAYMKSLGFPDPVEALSGNGYHLLYRIDIPISTENKHLVEKCLKVLSMLFDTDRVKIDTTNFNPSRVCKLHGTLAQTGRSTEQRPHRMSRILNVPAAIEIADVETVKRLASELPDEPPAKQNTRRGSNPAKQEFDLLRFLSDNGITYTEDKNDRAKIYKLDECPFDSNHRNGDAKIFQYSDGAIAFKCHHNSCSEYRWQDVRLKFDPEAYSGNDFNDEQIDAGYAKHLQLKQEEQQPPQAPPKKRKVRKLKDATGIINKDIPEPRVFVGVGEELPLLVEGTCILSAKPKNGKSWLALAMCIAVANGDDFLGYKTRKCSTLYLDLETGEPIQKKRLKKYLKDDPVPENFYLDTETDRLGNGFIEQMEAYLKEDPNIGIIVVDVFQIIRTPAKGIKETEYEHAYRDITPLNELAQKYHISIILVCHDRKAVDPDDPFSNILGSTGLQGAVSQMIVMFRKRKDDPIHISVKGKTIDGLPELNVKLEDARWSIVDGVDSAAREKAELEQQFNDSIIRYAVNAIAGENESWQGRCSTLINDAVKLGIPITDTAKTVGGFLHIHQGRFLAEDDIQITFIKNGTGPTIYRIQKSTIDTIDENNNVTIDGFEKVSKQAASRVPFT